MSIRLIPSSLAFFLFSSVAFAQAEPDSQASEPQFIVPAVTTLDMEGALVDGVTVKPGISLCVLPGQPTHAPMLPIRTSFNDEIAQSVDSVR